jgi:3-oxoadipate enol-lactonase
MPFDPFDHDLERGLRNRRQILGDAWVDQSLANTNELNAEFQNFFTRYAWHEVWGRPGLAPDVRRIIVLVVTAALGRWEEFELHTRAALHGGDPATRLTLEQVREALIQLAIYAGVPAANTAFSHVQKIQRDAGQAPRKHALADTAHPGVGRPMRTRSLPAVFATVREPRNGLTPRHTVVFSHALGCDGSMWDHVANALAEDCRVICHDHRGHGRSDAPPGPYTLAELADDVARLLDELGTGPVVFAGLSMGGMVAQELALRHPARVKALVIANSSSGYGAEGRGTWQQRIAAIEAGGLEAIVDMAMQRWFHPGFHAAHPAAVQRWRRRVLATDPQGYMATCQALMHLDTTARLPQIRVPALVIAGALDQGTPPAMSRVIADGIAGARLLVLEEASHLSVLEQPGPFLEAVTAFMDSL